MWNERLPQFRAQHRLRLAHFAVPLKDLLAFFVIEVQVLGNLAQGPVGEPVHTEFLFQEIDRHTAEIQTPRNFVVEEAVFILLQRAVLCFFIGLVVVELVEVERLIFVLGILVEKIGPIDISKSNTGLSIPQFFFQPLKDGLLPPILQSLLVRLVGQAVNAGDDI
jgi:hypothetical protein